MRRRIFLVLAGWAIWSPHTAWAYPEYAARYNVISCTACHLSPVGGGPKTTYGKLFGAHGYNFNPSLAQDYVGADFRALFYHPEKPATTRSGAGVMYGSVYGHVAIDQAERIHLVLEHNIGGFSAAPYRDTYVLFRLAQDDGQSHWFKSLLVGRFRPPFGLITDEHRTYTRIQTATEWYSFDTGIMLSGAPRENFHYDFALTNGDRSTGSTLNRGNAQRFGGVLNMRYMHGPALLGTSISNYDTGSVKNSRRAISFYTVASIARWTNDKVPLSVKIEYVRARNWGDHLGTGFAADQAYVNAVKNEDSAGWLAWFDYALNQKLTLIYKYDLLTPDRDYPADLYDRHGVGFRWAIGPNTLVHMRTEIARATQPTERRRTSTAAQDATFAILQVSF